MRRYFRLASWMTAALLGLGAIRATAEDPADPPDDTTPPERVHGWLELSAPEGQEGSGLVKVRQVGERLAIHVMVRNLEPGVVYAVGASRTAEDGTTIETAALGTITTRTEVPPLPWCFSAKLAAPVVEEPPPEAGGAGHGDHGGGDGWHWPPRPETGGLATFHRNSEGTELHYSVRLYGAGATAAVVLQVTPEQEALPLLPDEEGKLRGTLVLDPATGVIEALAAGGARVVVTEVVTEGEPAATTLEGAVKSCFPMLDRFRERMAARLAGTGVLKLDTAREDAMPFGIVAAKDLVGATIAVSGPGEATDVVLSGTFAEDSFRVCPPPRRWPPVGDPAGGGAAFDPDEDQLLSETDTREYFGVPELHDASFIRGDVDDDGSVGLSDAISSLTFLFRGGAAPYCADAADANDSGSIDVADPILTLIVLFRGEGSMASPFPAAGFDRTADGLFCREIGG